MEHRVPGSLDELQDRGKLERHLVVGALTANMTVALPRLHELQVAPRFDEFHQLRVHLDHLPAAAAAAAAAAAVLDDVR
eukprot:9102293-Alexandrium_andersonii.AAC.1